MVVVEHNITFMSFRQYDFFTAPISKISGDKIKYFENSLIISPVLAEILMTQYGFPDWVEETLLMFGDIEDD